MAANSAREWRAVAQMAQAMTELEAKAAGEREALQSEASKLPERRALAIERLSSYMGPGREPGNEAVLRRLGVVDEFNAAMVTDGIWRGTAEQFRRLDANYQASPATGDRMASRREQFDQAIASNALASIQLRRDQSLRAGSADAEHVAQIEAELFDYRAGLRNWNSGGRKGPAPRPGDELADRMIEVARTDKVFGYAIGAQATGRASFLFDEKLGKEEAMVCRALKRHGEAQYAAGAIDANADALRIEGAKLGDALGSISRKAQASGFAADPLLDASSPDHFGRLDMGRADDRAKVVQTARRLIATAQTGLVG